MSDRIRLLAEAIRADLEHGCDERRRLEIVQEYACLSPDEHARLNEYLAGLTVTRPEPEASPETVALMTELKRPRVALAPPPPPPPPEPTPIMFRGYVLDLTDGSSPPEPGPTFTRAQAQQAIDEYNRKRDAEHAER